jgi:thiosulfate/3-mercaptopyruvate sulfurtransferase
MYTTLISILELKDHLDDTNWAIVDCRYSLQDSSWGRREYLQAHIPGAVYAHLDQDLSAPVKPGVTGRHPLPSPQQAAQVFSNMGIAPGVQVVAYDAAGGALAAVRLWWMLRWLGHTAAAVLDGGWLRWQEEGLPVRADDELRSPLKFILDLQHERVASADDIEDMRRRRDARVLDARNADRFRGENEIIDPVAGHIPGAVCAPYVENLTHEGVFKSKEELRARYEEMLDGVAPEDTAVYCGSGVTSIHTILAMVYAGMGEPRLYAGSWSEWILDPDRPVALGI